MSSTTDNAASISPPARKQSDATGPKGEDGGDTCRICRGEGTPEQPLFYPCKCSGSIKFVHQECLMEWLSHSQKKYCELCKTPFRFTKLYNQSMPEKVPFLLFLRQAGLHVLRAAGRWSRYILVILVWLCWLPWVIRQIWRGLFWIADGSWLTNYEMRAAIENYASQSENNGTSAAFQAAILNVTLARSPQAENLAFVSSLAGLLSFLDFATALRWTLRAVLNIVITSGTLSKWGESLISFTPLPRPPSLLSGVQSINSATNLPLLNNAIIDVLEGQLICLTIVAAFILVFLLREWVINQQPLLNMPDAEHQDNLAPAPQEAEAPVRRRRRGLPRPLEHNHQLENRPLLPARRPRAQPRLRRAATDNNILIPNPNGPDTERPVIPPRAASLVPALQEMEDTVRQMGTLQQSPISRSTEQLQSPPLQRGLFDEVGQIRRRIEEGNAAAADETLKATSSTSEITAQPGATNFAFGTPRGTETGQATSNTFTFRAGNQFAEPEPYHEGSASSGNDRGHEADWVSDSDHEPISTPRSSNNSQGVNPTGDQDIVFEGLEEIDTPGVSDHEENDITPEVVLLDEPHTTWARLSNWLWHTDDYVPGEALVQDADDTEMVEDVIDHPPFVPVVNREEENNIPNAPGAAAGPQGPEPNIQDGINVDDPNAIDDAEDLEGILELIGMEGPIAGMIQNIIFSVFLISLTLSASVWCPYIWGKIALLFIAHPFSIFIKAPLYLISRTADVIVDIFLFIIGGAGLTLNNVTKFIKYISLPVLPWFSNFLNVQLLEDYAYSLSSRSGARLEKALAGTFFGLRPDLPTFSMQSHHVLRALTKAITEISSAITSSLLQQGINIAQSVTWNSLFELPVVLGTFAKSFPSIATLWFNASRDWLHQLQHDLRPISFAKASEIDYSLVSWSSQEKIACIILGYVLFSLAGYIYLQAAHLFLGLKKEEKVPGVFADTLRQAGGVLKVIIIIGVEMIVFPLYCGIMLDIALLPLFEDANLQSRFAFFVDAPTTALFVHWFLGTCYMFHFALFVSMCRRIMRKGVLYFVRDPDDPTFHPVRDVLERSVATQLGKIAFSALVYGSLLVICLGGVIQGLNRLGSVLPIHWSAREPLMRVPGDIVFYNFMLPFILRRIDLSDKVSVGFDWWFRACAGGLRLTDFLFGTDSEQEKQPAAFLWRRFFKKLTFQDVGDAPATPSKETVNYFEQLAKHPERLFWFENTQGKADEVAVRAVFGQAVKFKLINVVENNSQILIEFDKRADLKQVKKDMDREDEKDRSNIRVKQVRDMKIDVLFLRNTPVDRAAGRYVRAPAKDSVRIPKGTNVFVQVDEHNKRLDNQTDSKTGLHGSKDERFARLFVPTHFRARISVFIALVWIFAAFLGLVFTVGPLVIGRFIIKSITGIKEPINDLYAVTVGMHALSAIIYLVYNTTTRDQSVLTKTKNFFANTKQAISHIISAVQRVSSIAYLIITIGIVLPVSLSILTELYIHVPIYIYIVSTRDITNSGQFSRLVDTTSTNINTPTIHLLQTWTLGLLYLRIAVHILTTTPHTNTRAATAVRGIIRHGYTRPDIRLASRALVLPVLTVCIVLLGLPVLIARVVIAMMPKEIRAEQRVAVYQNSYPALLVTAVAVFVVFRLKARLDSWRVRIRDEVYLIGERLHNFPRQEKEDKKKGKGHKKDSSNTSTKSKGKDKAKEQDEEKERRTRPKRESAPWRTGDTYLDSEGDGIEEAMRRSTVPSLACASERAGDRVDERGGGEAASTGGRDPMADAIDDFKAVTGLEGAASAEELGGITRAVVEMQREGDGDAN